MDQEFIERLIDDLLIEKPHNPDLRALYDAVIVLLKSHMPD